MSGKLITSESSDDISDLKDHDVQDDTIVELDDLQSHMLGLISNIMVWYNLHPTYVESSYLSLVEKFNQIYEMQKNSEESNNDINQDVSDCNMSDDTDDNIVWATTRREFRQCMLDGLKICPKYSSCQDSECTFFHVKRENICDHAINDNYCDDHTCNKIIIKKCRKGNKCIDESCSFRHVNRE